MFSLNLNQKNTLKKHFTNKKTKKRQNDEYFSIKNSPQG